MRSFPRFVFESIPFSLICLLSWVALGCDLINPKEEIPAFIYVPAFELRTDIARQGSNSARITEVWVTADDQFLGAFPLPATIPVLAAGETEIMLQAGIKDNGISALPEIYPFYQPFIQAVPLIPGQTDTIRPLITYREDAKFAFVEDFETAPWLFSELITGADTNRITRDSRLAFEGNFSGTFFLDRENPSVALATSEVFSDLITKSIQVYLEVDYKSEAPVVFGIIGRNENNPEPGRPAYDPGFLPKENWNKIYFNLSLLLLENSFDEYQISLQAFLPTQDGKFTADNARVWLDNIKLVHF